MMMLYLFFVVPVSCMYTSASNDPASLRLRTSPEAVREAYGQAGGPYEAAGGGRERRGQRRPAAREKARQRTVMAATAVRDELRGIRAEILRIRGGKALTP